MKKYVENFIEYVKCVIDYFGKSKIIGFIFLFAIIINGILMYVNILSSWCGYLNFPLAMGFIYFLLVKKY